MKKNRFGSQWQWFSTIFAVLLLSIAGIAVHSEPKPKPSPTQSKTSEGNTLETHLQAFLNRWHQAASQADAQVYLGSLHEHAVFLGTDKTERWSKPEFSRFTKTYFDQGKGWTYTARERNIYFNQEKTTAWFDEKLSNAKYGDVRGSGVLLRTQAGWKIVQYNLSFPIPNAVTKNVVKLISEQTEAHPK